MLHPIQKMPAPGIFVTIFDSFEQIAICGRRIDAHQHGLISLVNLIVQAYFDVRKVLILIDLGGCRGGSFEPIVDSPNANRRVEEISE